MNRLSGSAEFAKDCKSFKKAFPNAYPFIKKNLALLRNSEPRTMDEIEWDEEEDIYTWVFHPSDLGAPCTVEVDLHIFGSEIYLLRLVVT